MEKVNVKNLNIYKLDSISIPHYESIIYHNNEFCFKIYNNYKEYAYRESIIEELNSFNIESTIVPLKKIIIRNNMNEIFIGYIMKYYKEYNDLRTLILMNKLDYKKRIEVVIKLNRLYRLILSYGFNYWDSNISNILYRDGNILLCDMDSVKKIDSDIYKDKERLFITSINIIMGMMSREIINNYDYFSSVFDKEITSIFDRFYSTKNDNKDIFESEIYMDNMLDRVNIMALKRKG